MWKRFMKPQLGLEPKRLPIEVRVADRVLPVKVVPHARARRLTLRIEVGGQALRITTPDSGVQRGEIERFIEHHRGWIEEKLAQFSPPGQKLQLHAGAQIAILGLEHRIFHEAGRGTAKVCYVNQQPAVIVYGDPAYLPRRLGAFLKKQATTIMAPIIDDYCARIGKQPRAVRYKDTKSRWGSCSSAGCLSFSWRIIMAPKGVVEYLVAHEVAHLVEMNHGKAFWALCEQLCPETEYHKAWLKRHGHALQAIAFQ